MIIRVYKKEALFAGLVGLLGKKKPQPILLKTRFGIHTFGMQFAIDVIILSKNSTIAEFKTNLKPNRLFFWNPEHNTVLELPKGFIKKKKLQKQQKITLVEIS